MTVSDAIRTSIRAGDHAVRTGGDEFCVLLPGADQPTASDVAARIRSAIAASTEMMSPEYRVTLSIGGATAEAAHSSFADLYRHADRNLYQVKQQGRDQTVTT